MSTENPDSAGAVTLVWSIFRDATDNDNDNDNDDDDDNDNDNDNDNDKGSLL